MNVMKSIVCLVLALVLPGCVASLPEKIPPGSKTYQKKVDTRIMISRRSYLVHVPPVLDAIAPLPPVVVVHGAFDTAKGMEKISGFSALADEEGFVALYPNGMGLLGFLQHWNAGHCCGKAAADDVDDVGFLLEVIADVQQRLPIDPARIYMVGFSNGGMLAYRFAAEKTGVLAALATVAATAGGKASQDQPLWHIPDPAGPLPLITFHGLSDGAIPAAGGISPDRGGSRSFLSVSDSVSFWVRNNGCSADPVEREERQGTLRIQSWKACRQNADVKLYLIEGWQHVWPGRHYTADLDEDSPLRDFDAAALIWEFFKGHCQ